MFMEAAAKDIAARRPDLKRLTRGKDLADAILDWRRKLEEAKPDTFLREFSERIVDQEEAMQRVVPSTEWRQRAYILLAHIRP